MRLLRELQINDGARVHSLQVCEGDLADTPPEFASDILVVSAFDGDYIPTPRSVMGALYRAGLSVGDLAKVPDQLLQSRHCWISHPLQPSAGIPYKRVVCTETPSMSSVRAAAGDLFRAVTPFLITNPGLSSVATGVLGAGDQGANWDEMFQFLVKEAAIYLKGGLPIHTFRIVVRGEDKALQAASIFDRLRSEDRTIGEAFDRTPQFDAFISYCRRDIETAYVFHDGLTKLGLNVFMDKTNLEAGETWPERIDQAISRTKVFVALITEAFNRSLYCSKEADLADILFGTGSPSLFPIRLADVPPDPPLSRRHAPLLNEEGSVADFCSAIQRKATWHSF